MATQLIAPHEQTVRNCADQIARCARGRRSGRGRVEDGPMEPNPVTQDEVDAGSVELF